MKSLNNIYFRIKPVYHIFLFELTLQVKKFIIFSGIAFLQLFLNSYIRILLMKALPTSLDLFYYDGTNYFVLIINIAVSLFFSGIICSEYKDKTGLVILPLIDKNKLVIGKYIANLLLVIGITIIHFSLLILFGYNFYGEPIFNTWILSFWVVILYIITLGSIVTFFSSFMSSSTLIIVLILGLTFIGFDFIDGLFISLFSDLKPIYSLSYLSKLILDIILIDFDISQKYISIGAILIIMLIYIIIFFILALVLFKRREF